MTLLSFKIFPQFWLAKSTLIIHHNQLMMTKFRRILHSMKPMTSKVQPFCMLMHHWPRRPGDKVELFWLWKQKWRTFHSFQEWELGEIKWQEQHKDIELEGWHLPFGEYLRSWTTLNVHYQRWTWHACFSYIIKLGIILNE